jgi:phosphoribosylformimino-5-aminoimidazole carboxamide ribotide isomerase
MQIWPAIDLRGGKCVRLQQGDYNRETVFGDDPAEMARRWVREGADRLHLVDLDGARDGLAANKRAVESILAAVDVPCQLGGGVRSDEAIDHWLAIGITRLVVGTRALKEPDWFRSACHRNPGRLVLGIDARDGMVATDGWREVSHVAAIDLASNWVDEPLAAIVYTDISRDGMMAGPNFQAMGEMRRAVSLPVVASGGVTTCDDVKRLAEIGMAGCIIGRSLYEGSLQLGEAIAAAKQFLT